MTQITSSETCVLYNADCPVCSTETNHYVAYSAANALPIAFDDLNDAEKLRRWGLDADTAAKRLHVIKDGHLLSGIPAFVALWQEMPRYRWLARLVSLPGLNRLSCWVYDLVLAPLICQMHRRRQARRPARS
jgi:predicted DCC family thiol-disulfide oxidoreductase YuxK